MRSVTRIGCICGSGAVPNGSPAVSPYHHQQQQQQPSLALSHGCQSGALLIARRYRLTNGTVLNTVKQIADEKTDMTHKMVYLRKRQADAIAFAIKEKETLAATAQRQLEEEDSKRRERETHEAYMMEAAKLGGPAAAARMQETLDKDKPKYVRSMDAFGDKSVRLKHSFSGMADNRILQWWEILYWNYIRFFFTQELLIGKDRYGNRFTVTWQFVKNREEQRRMYRRDSNKKHQPYGALATDDRLWERWMRGHRGEPPTVAEEEHMRDYKRQFFGAMVLENEEVEDSLMRLIAHMNRSQAMMQELDDDQDYPDAQRVTRPLRDSERQPGEEAEARQKKGATWTKGFVRGDLFYNEQEVQVMRKELGHLFRNMEWQELEYKRQVRMNKRQDAPGKPPEGTTDPNVLGEPMKHYWERTDLGIPYHAAVPDLTTPQLERLRIESDQLEDERLALRKELGLTDLGDIREGRDPIQKDHAPFDPAPPTARWKPKCWEEPWGTGGGATPY